MGDRYFVRVDTVLVISPEVRYGGLTEHSRCLALGAAQVGDEILVVAPAIVDDIAFPDNTEVIRKDFASATGISEIEGMIGTADAVLLVNSPQTGLLVPLLSGAKAAAVGAHGSPSTNSTWSGQRVHGLTAAAVRSLAHLPILIPAASDREGIASEFGVPQSRVVALPNAIEPDPIAPPLPAGCERIMAPVRISNEKAWLLEAAIEAANLTGVELTVVGVGPHVADWRERLERRVRGPWILVEDPNIREHIRTADVVVGAGMVALEAAQMRRRVLVPCKAGGWAGAVTPDSLQDLRAANFVLWAQPWSIDTSQVWAGACSLSATDLDEISRWVGVEASPVLMYQRLRRATRRPGPVDPADLVVATTHVLADAVRVEEGLHKDYATVLEARNYFEQQATNWEANYRALSGAETVERLPRRRRLQRDRVTSGTRVSSVALRMYNSRSLTLHRAAAYLYFVKKEGRLNLRRRPSETVPVRIRRNADIPRLSWVARRRFGGWEFTVGSAVEFCGHGFFEGVWDGDFAAFRPHLSPHRFGSGMIMTEVGPTFTCSSVGDPVYVVIEKATNDVVVSNSPIFALTASGILPGDDDFDDLTEDIRARAKVLGDLGIERAPTLLSQNARAAMHMVSYFNFSVTETGRITRDWTVPQREFRTFEQYRGLLRTTLDEALRNGADVGRRHRLTPIVPISRGYDSTACAVIAAEVGCREAVTLDVTVEGRHDSGEENARSLGLDVSVHRHFYGDDLKSLTVGQIGPVDDQVAEFVATTGRSGNILYTTFAHKLRDRVLISGAGGDPYWPREVTATSGLTMSAEYMRGTVEFRLRVGFANVPLPCVGTRFIPAIAALNRSDEMARFSIGGDYDRPVPRRIIEEAGLARDSFGSAKTATAPDIAGGVDLFLDAARVVAKRYEHWDADGRPESA